MTELPEKDDTSSDSQDVEYTSIKPTVDLDEEFPPSTARCVDPKAHRDAVRYYHSPCSSRDAVSVQVDTDLINRKAKADELNSILEDKD